VGTVKQLFGDLDYYSKCLRESGEALVALANEKKKLKKIGHVDYGLSRLSNSTLKSYSLSAKYLIETGRDLLRLLSPQYRQNPYELSLSTFEHFFRMAKNNAAASEQYLRRVSRSGDREAIRKAAEIHKAMLRAAKDAANSCVIVAEALGKRTEAWERRLGLTDFLG